MRTYKFRGKSEYGWRFGDLKTDLTNGDCTSIYDGLTPCLDYEVHPYSVGQLTGLHDDNDSEIYEDDIIHVLRINDEQVEAYRLLVEAINKLKAL